MSASYIDIGKQEIGIIYEPLTVGGECVCTSAGSPSDQVYNSADDEFEPDRSVIPCSIVPFITAIATDGTWKYGTSGNPALNLTTMKWYVDDVEISTISDWSGLYTINENADYERGRITIKKNITAGTSVKLHFEGDVVDYRKKTTIHVKTTPIFLSSTDKSEDQWSVSAESDTNIEYNPLKDPLLLYEYNVAHGNIEADSTTKATAQADKNSYVKTVNWTVRKGKKAQTEGWTVKMFKMVSGSWSQIQVSDGAELLELTTTSAKFDIRTIEAAQYYVGIYINEVEKMAVNIGFKRLYPKFHAEPSNRTARLPSDVWRKDELIVTSDNVALDHPELCYRIVWMTSTTSIGEKEQNEGEVGVYHLATAGATDTGTLTEWCKMAQKPAYSYAKDSDGNQFVDENGNKFILN